MRLLLDQNLPPALAVLLGAYGHDAVHVAPDLESGAIVVLDDERIRIRRLPLRPSD